MGSDKHIPTNVIIAIGRDILYEFAELEYMTCKGKKEDLREIIIIGEGVETITEEITGKVFDNRNN